jgi:flagellar basal body rod protein FlgB
MMAFENADKTSWENYLPLAQRILNSQIHSTLGCTPVELMFGNNVNLESEVMHMAETELRYQTLTDITATYFSGLKNVIREGK